MKANITMCTAGLIMGLLVSLASAQTNSFTSPRVSPLGTVQTYTYNVTDSGQPRYSATPQVQTPAMPSGTALRGQTAAPQPKRPVRTAYQQPMPQTTPALQRPASAPAKKKQRVHRAANRPNPPVVASTRIEQQKRASAPNAYRQSYPAQPYGYQQQTYNQRPPASYSSNPYQSQYASSPSYYQGYSYNWGSSGQACPPGKA